MKPLMQQIDELACNALRQEVMLDNKPGLVCPSRQGSHVDMNCTTFQKKKTSSSTTIKNSNNGPQVRFETVISM